MDKVTVLDTPEQIDQYRMAVVRQGIKALMIGMKINSGYTSTRCRAFVTNLTGIKYPAGKNGLTLALLDLNELIGDA
tara:strand:+ start:338 stop:568 length:231 start_codon:yes stop_codon:yes gene_type:complete